MSNKKQPKYNIGDVVYYINKDLDKHYRSPVFESVEIEEITIIIHKDFHYIKYSGKNAGMHYENHLLTKSEALEQFKKWLDND